MSYDPECAKLARHFLGDLAADNHPRFLPELAQAIQDAVEEWIGAEAERIKGEIDDKVAAIKRPPQ